MLRISVLVLFISGLAYAQEPKIDKTKVFERLDGNTDGKLSKDEFKKFTERMMERLKDKLPKAEGLMEKMTDQAFEKLDTNKDGSISKEEFEKADFKSIIDIEKLKELREKAKEKQ